MRKNRIISLLLLLCLSVGLVTGAYAAGTELTVETPETLPAVGESFTVTVSLTGNPRLGTVQFTLAYDKTVLECVDADLGAILDDTIVGGTNPKAKSGAKFAAVAADSFAGDGVLAKAVFKVLKAGSPAFALKDLVLSKPDGAKVTVATKFVGSRTPATPTPTPTPSAKPTPTPTPTPTPSAKPEKPSVLFTDVPESHWAAAYIERAVNAGIIVGNTDGTFNPEGSVTRAQFVTMLWRMAGRPASKGSTPFTDIANTYSEFKSAIAWASEQGYINGITPTVFGPNETITRQQAMTILFRYSGGKSGMELMLTGVYDSQYTDSASISPYAKPGVYWAVYYGIVTGITDTTIVPNGTATRAQTTVILARYTDKFQSE